MFDSPPAPEEFLNVESGKCWSITEACSGLIWVWLIRLPEQQSPHSTAANSAAMKRHRLHEQIRVCSIDAYWWHHHALICCFEWCWGRDHNNHRLYIYINTYKYSDYGNMLHTNQQVNTRAETQPGLSWTGLTGITGLKRTTQTAAQRNRDELCSFSSAEKRHSDNISQE